MNAGLKKLYKLSLFNKLSNDIKESPLMLDDALEVLNDLIQSINIIKEENEK